MLKPIIDCKLAHPCGIALSLDEDIIYVAETGRNRILRIVAHSSGVYHTSVYYQFSGRFGPTALAVSPDGKLYVARFDFAECNKNGLISVINQEGVLEEELQLFECP